MITIKRMPQFDAWFAGIKDDMTRRRLLMRLRKVSLGNLGDVKPVGDGVW
jgi:putative addiction module killer protein